MRKLIPIFLLSFLFTYSLVAQDEGAITKRERIVRDKNIFAGGGISIVGGSNFGDYSNGINFEGGYIKRLNRVFSIGGSISYLSFKYDDKILKNKPDVNGTGLSPDFYYDTQAPSIDYGYFLSLQGGDITITSLALNLKLNFLPVKDNSIISIYGFAKPFIASAQVSTLEGKAEYIYYDMNLSDWFYDSKKDVAETFKSKSSITGGIYIGPGIEFFPARSFSVFAQASFGYTFPINIVSTRSYTNDINQLTGDFPFKSLGFTSINFSAGISINLD